MPDCERARTLDGTEGGSIVTEDIVCNQELGTGRELWRSTYHGKTYYFCSLLCREVFELEPEAYLPAKQRSGEIPMPVLMRMVA